MNNNFKERKIIVGVTGSIAAYKTPLLIRELIKNNAEVKVIMTPSANNFVTKTVLANLSKNPVIDDMFAPNLQDTPAWHIHLAHWCELMIIAPCSATTLSRLANGLCDTALSTVTIALPKETPVLISPAMDSTMWEHPATQKNVQILKDYGYIIIPPEQGDLASGLIGPGRMPEIDILINYISKYLTTIPKKNLNLKPQKENINKIDENKLKAEIDLESMKQKKIFKETIGLNLKNKNILITAGPTYEKIDDVRFISNYSSGKMGFALAEQAALAGANVTLVTGPVALETPENVKRINVESAKEMFDVVVREFEYVDIAILAAAVSDFTIAQKFDGKIKKEEIGSNLQLELKQTDDILHQLGLMKKPGQKLIGFALESQNAISNGWKKLKTKNCNMIVVNTINQPNSGFGGDKNTITLLLRDGKQYSYEPMSKTQCAREILLKIQEL